MEKKGSITVFLALILSLLLSLVATSIQSVQAAAARTPTLAPAATTLEVVAATLEARTTTNSIE